MNSRKNIKRPRNEDADHNLLSQEDWDEFERGVNYFNEAHFGHAFEAWKLVSERCKKGDRQVIHSLMEAASTFQKTNSSEIIKGIDKITEQLEPYKPERCGLLVTQLIASLKDVKDKIQSCDPHKLPSDYCRVRIQLLPPSNPDFDVEVFEICGNPEFLQGVQLFNKGYYWEAHETWEEMWRDQSGTGKSFMETFVQLAEGYSFAKKGKTDSAQYLFSKAMKKFQDYRQVQCQVSIPDIVQDIERAVGEINSFRRNGTTHFTLSSAPVIVFNGREKTAQ
jgi:predicted metal-dependent hydrolase